MTKEELAIKLKQLRQAANLTQQNVADKLQLKSNSTISMWESGKSEPDILTFLFLCCEYGMSEAKALVKVLQLDEASALEETPVITEETTDENNSNKKPYVFCPYCGEKLNQ